MSDEKIKKALVEWCEICGVRTERINNMWARKTMINTALTELRHPEQVVMSLTGHKSAEQMRRDYYLMVFRLR